MIKIHLRPTCLLAAAILFSTVTVAKDLGQGLANESDSLLLKNKNNQNTQWNGVGKILHDDVGHCTASLLDTRNNNNKAVGPAYLLTAAHCVKSDYDDVAEETIKFNYFNDTPEAYKSYTIKKTIWQDYRHTDLAIMELDSTLAQLLEAGITPLQLAPKWRKKATDVLAVNAPEGLPEHGIRLAACTQEPTRGYLVEGVRVSYGTLKNRCKDIRGGSSGSPVVDRKNGQIISVLATSTYGATIDEKCLADAPCEIIDKQPVWSPDTIYALPADALSSCFVDGVFTSTARACMTYTPIIKNFKSAPTVFVTMPESITDPDPVIKLNFVSNTPSYRFKTVREAYRCESADGYSESIKGIDVNIKAPISRNLGMHYLCVVGVDSAEQPLSRQILNNATSIPAQLIARLPVPMPEPTITLNAQWNYEIEWRYLIPRYAMTLYYSGPADQTDCEKIDIDAYTRIYEPITVNAEQLPVKLCSKNVDISKRHSEVRTDLLALP